MYCVFISVLTRMRLYTCLRECRRACGWCSFGRIEESTSYLDNVSAAQCYVPLSLVLNPKRRTSESARVGSALSKRAKSVLRSPLQLRTIAPPRIGGAARQRAKSVSGSPAGCVQSGVVYYIV